MKEEGFLAVEVGFGEEVYPTTAKELYSQHYFECIDSLLLMQSRVDLSNQGTKYSNSWKTY